MTNIANSDGASNIHIDANHQMTEYPAVVNNAFGETTVNFTLPVSELISRVLIPNEHGIESNYDQGDAPSNRPYNQGHALKLARYMLKAEVAAVERDFVKRGMSPPADVTRIVDELGRESYHAISPIVVNVRPKKPLNIRNDEYRHSVLSMASDELLRVIDGQHRTMGREIGGNWLKVVVTTGKYPTGRKSGPVLYLPADGRTEVSEGEMKLWTTVHRQWLRSGVEVTLHLGLGTDQERQLFYVLNKLSLPVGAGLAFDFDESNPINVFIKKTLMAALKLEVVTKDIADRDDGEIALKDMLAINAILFLNKTNVKSATAKVVNDRAALATRFWEAVTKIPGFGQPGAKRASVAAQSVVIKGLAKLFHDFAFGPQSNPEIVENILAAIPGLPLSHHNEPWRYYRIPADLRENKWPGLPAYMPSEETGKRDLGYYDEAAKYMRFGTSHNDIYPLLADYFRWHLHLPKRSARPPTKRKLKGFQPTETTPTGDVVGEVLPAA